MTAAGVMLGRYWPDTPIPLRADGTLDVLEVCRFLDEQTNRALPEFSQVRPYKSNRCSATVEGAPGTPASAPELVNHLTMEGGRHG